MALYLLLLKIEVISIDCVRLPSYAIPCCGSGEIVLASLEDHPGVDISILTVIRDSLDFLKKQIQKVSMKSILRSLNALSFSQRWIGEMYFCIDYSI